MAHANVPRTEPGEPHKLEYGGEAFVLPPVLPVAALDATITDDLLGFFKALLGDQWKAFGALLNPADLPALGLAVGELYGPTLGESAASGSSSTPTTAS